MGVFSNNELMSGCGIFLHALTRGWQRGECNYAATVVLQAFNTDGALTKVLDENYILGSEPLLEENIHCFLYSVFWKEALLADRSCWFLSLIDLLCPGYQDKAVLAKILMLQLTMARRNREPLAQDWSQWEDHRFEDGH